MKYTVMYSEARLVDGFKIINGGAMKSFNTYEEADNYVKSFNQVGSDRSYYIEVFK